MGKASAGATRWIVVAALGAGATLAGLGAWTARAAPEPAEAPAIRWQYRVLAIGDVIEQGDRNWDEIMFLDQQQRRLVTGRFEAHLNAVGGEGWNLYHVGDYMLIFKRPAP